jgi:hypothetical protein
MTIAPTIVINIKTRIVSSIGKSLIAVGESRRAFARIRPPELGVFGPSPVANFFCEATAPCDLLTQTDMLAINLVRHSRHGRKAKIDGLICRPGIRH